MANRLARARSVLKRARPGGRGHGRDDEHDLKHLRVLREAGLVKARPDAQRRVYGVNPRPLAELDAWLAPYRRLWEQRLDALERHLDRTANEQED
jgi:DNA-binding transcriptional ArsR family regulator